MLKYKIPWKSF